MTVIIDYHTGNLGSILNMIRKSGHEAVISDEMEVIKSATRIILPGVGSFDFGMHMLNTLGVVNVIRQKVLEDKTPILGICLGAQLLCQSSEEGKMQGLGLIEARVVKFPSASDGKKYPVPHMGWDHVKPAKTSRLMPPAEEVRRFYFVHSYCIQCRYATDVLAENTYSLRFHSAFEHENILGVQFHPEKSHRFGKEIYKNFIEQY
ncbi:MAG: imidazole glycerol phosphate synthase subunit HisH [Cyclobacteriaceae bacterium]|nr:imidazole glycerol phosphate synthase subunit HisH [Cyclobacteriaceae bacterium]